MARLLFPEIAYATFLKVILNDYYQELLPSFPGYITGKDYLEPNFNVKNIKINRSVFLDTLPHFKSSLAKVIFMPFDRTCISNHLKLAKPSLEELKKSIGEIVFDLGNRTEFDTSDFNNCFYLNNKEAMDKMKQLVAIEL